jgi:hypothetical protein
VNFGSAPAVLSQEYNLSLELYPNPAGNVLNIKLISPAERVNIKIYNAIGQIIDDFNVENDHTTVNLSAYPKGIYYIGADDGIQNTLKKFFKE